MVYEYLFTRRKWPLLISAGFPLGFDSLSNEDLIKYMIFVILVDRCFTLVNIFLMCLCTCLEISALKNVIHNTPVYIKMPSSPKKVHFHRLIVRST